MRRDLIWGSAIVTVVGCSANAPTTMGASVGSAGASGAGSSAGGAASGAGAGPVNTSGGASASAGSTGNGTAGMSGPGTSGSGPGGAGGGNASAGAEGSLGGDDAGGASASGGGAAGEISGSAGAPTLMPADCMEGEPVLAVTPLDVTTIAELGTPFDADEDDTIGPADWNTNYGKSPELVAVPFGSGFDVLWQDTAESPARGFVVHVEPEGESYAIQTAYEVELIDRIMGFARDEGGNYYYATGIDEDADITTANPPEGEHRSGIVRVVKFAPSGCVAMSSDVDVERGALDEESEAIVNPMVAGSSRLAVADGQVALLHSINTPPDDSEVRHQKAITTHLDATTGVATRTDTMWVSHSFDQRLFWDGTGFVELHLGDAYPRRIALGRFTADSSTDSYGLFAPKGAEGDNATYTRLGGIVPVPDGDYGFLVVFETDRSADIATEQWQALVGPHDLALVRIARGFEDMDASGSDFVDQSLEVQTVESSGESVDNHLAWLTDYGAEATEAHAGRSRIAAISGGNYVVLWERWDGVGEDEEFAGTYALEIDAAGAVVTAAMPVSDRHIPRGDDAFTLNGKAALVLGDGAAQGLTLLLVGAGLETTSIALP